MEARKGRSAYACAYNSNKILLSVRSVLLLMLLVLSWTSPPRARAASPRVRRHDNHHRNSNHRAPSTTSAFSSSPRVRRYLSVHDDSALVVVEGRVTPAFACPACVDALRDEQDALLRRIRRDHCASARVVASHGRIVNALTLRIPYHYDDDDGDCLRLSSSSDSAAAEDDSALWPAIDAFVRELNDLPQIARAYVSSNWYPDKLRETVEYIGSLATTLQFCLKGDGVRVAVLDSGLDYTHQALSGNGTWDAYLDAYGFNKEDPLNTVRGDLFPTQRVVDGYDFIGDRVRPNDPDWDAVAEDDDPIDGGFGHGTGVAHALLGVAGNARLIALKVCVVAGSCPEFAILSAVEFALDPDGDNDTSDHVDIINLSLGRPYTHPYYSAVGKAIEDAFRLGVLTVVAAGNNGNRPGVLFEAASTPNALAVGATGVAESVYEESMADYSSRGSPWGTGAVKPDIVAPGGPFDLAAAGTGSIYHKAIEGTSYSTPLVAGAAALIKQRCPECSPFAIKAILMNNAKRGIRYPSVDADRLAPISWTGAGELQVHKSLNANFWAYNLVDTQPSLSLGVLNVARDTVISKTIRVRLLDDRSDDQPLTVRTSFQFRDPEKADVMQVSFSPRSFSLDRTCGDVQDVIVTVAISADRVPANHMTTGGQAGIDAVASLDPNEVDGWVVLTSNERSSGEFVDVSLPLYAAVRRSADVHVANTELPSVTAPETVVNAGIQNNGAGTAQIDTFELVHTSADNPEAGLGSGTPPTDFRYVGYRTVFVGESGCDYLVEFAFHTWETVPTTVNSFFEAHIDRDGDQEIDVTLSNRGPHQHQTSYTECRIQESRNPTVWSCAGFPPDHAAYSSNTVIRACSNDLGLDSSVSSTLFVKFKSESFGRSSVEADKSETFAPILFPQPALAGPSFDVEPGAAWSNIVVTGPGQTPAGQDSMGLLLITNSYRSASSTGAATRQTEAIAIAREGIRIYQEQTSDKLVYPKANDVDGPICSRWAGPSSSSCNAFDNPAISSVLSFDEIYGQPDQPNTDNGGSPSYEGGKCVENTIPRLALSTRSPTTAPVVGSPTREPTDDGDGGGSAPDGILDQQQQPFSPTSPPTPTLMSDPDAFGRPSGTAGSSGVRQNSVVSTTITLLSCVISFSVCMCYL